MASEIVITRVNDAQTDWGFDEWLERGRQWWKASAARIVDCTKLIVLDSENRVMAVARIAGVEKDLDEGSGRVSILVRPLKDDELIGKVIRRYESRNPVVYMTEIEVLD
ncbi:hypothetical protein [Actinomyces vulturis]|uniref:hypothetical protein n=1 Tax=Actinomyces vulturis TaxID=1857645 RepID=UPI000829844F|nr:hypothetical protein [Actinomyces vulturis]